jgi:hypothetical protein
MHLDEPISPERIARSQFFMLNAESSILTPARSGR